MKGKDLLNAVGHVDADLIARAETAAPAKKKYVWVKWCAAAACLCLAVLAVIHWLPGRDSGAGTGPQTGGSDTGEYSVAVYPAEEKKEDVAEATCVSLTEAELWKAGELIAGLPVSLPEGYRFGAASLYETTMKSGARYARLLVTYRSGEERQGTIQEGAGGVEISGTQGEEFRVSVYSFRPDTTGEIMPADGLTEAVVEAAMSEGYRVFDIGKLYLGVEPLGQTAGEVLDVVLSAALAAEESAQDAAMGTLFPSAYPQWKENGEDVAATSRTVLTPEETANSGALSRRLPTVLPEEWFLAEAQLDVTKMKNGSKYAALFVTYQKGDWEETYDTVRTYQNGKVTEEKIPTMKRTAFTFCVFTYQPEDSREYLDIRRVTEAELEAVIARKESFDFTDGEYYYALSASQLTAREILEMVQSIGK